LKNINKVVMVIIGTLIGAGFASGKEIYLFFMKYGKLGQIGIVLSSIFTGLIIYFVLKKIKENQIENYADLLFNINPKNKKINKYINVIVNSFLLISFYIMIAGFSAYMEQAYKIPIYFSSIFFVIICYIVFQKSLQGMMKINGYLVPFLLFLILYLGIKNIPYLLESKISIEIPIKQNGFLISSLLYASYNSIILIPVLVTMKNCITTKKEISLISIFSGILMILLSFSIYGLLLKGQFFIEDLELPLIEITKEFGKTFQYIYGFVIIVSIFTSAISAGYSFLENVSKDKKSYKRNLIIISIVGVLVSNFGFSNLVQILYPMFGILGLIQIIFICKRRNTWNLLEKTIKNWYKKDRKNNKFRSWVTHPVYVSLNDLQSYEKEELLVIKTNIS